MLTLPASIRKPIFLKVCSPKFSKQVASIFQTSKFPILHKKGSPLSLRTVKTLNSFRMLCPVDRTNSFLIYSTLLNIKSIHSLLEYPLLCLAKHCFTAQQNYVSSILLCICLHYLLITSDHCIPHCWEKYL